jgi:hypothetical protein
MGGLANLFVLVGVGFRSDKGKHGRAVGRRNAYAALPGLKADVKGKAESKLIHVESQASILVANENVDRVNTKVGVVANLAVAITILATTGERGLIRQTER